MKIVYINHLFKWSVSFSASMTLPLHFTTSSTYHSVTVPDHQVFGHRVEHLGQLGVLLAYELPAVSVTLTGDLVPGYNTA